MNDFRQTVYDRSKIEAMSYADPREAYPHIYRENLEEAFTALINAVHTVDPEADLVYVGEDMGGPIWTVKFSEEKS